MILTSYTSSAHGCLIYIFLLNKSASFKRQYGGCVILAPFCCCVILAPDDAIIKQPTRNVGSLER